MKLSRKVRLSIVDTISAAFSDATLMGVVWNVYDEDDLRSGVDPVAPYVFILDFGVMFELKHLPAVMVQSAVHKRPLELGNLAWFCDAVVHIFGANRGDRDDISSAIKEVIDEVSIRDYNTAGNPVVQTQKLEAVNGAGDLWYETRVFPPNQMVTEGRLANWTTLACSFWVTDATA